MNSNEFYPKLKLFNTELSQRNTKMNTSSSTQLKNTSVAIQRILQIRIIYKCVMMEGNVKDGLRSLIWITAMMKYWIIIVVLLSVDQLSESERVCVCALSWNSTLLELTTTWPEHGTTEVVSPYRTNLIYGYMYSLSLTFLLFYLKIWEIQTLLIGRGDAQQCVSEVASQFCRLLDHQFR